MIDLLHPGESEHTRQWVVLAGVFVVLSLLALRLLLWKSRYGAWGVLGTGVVIAIGLLILF